MNETAFQTLQLVTVDVIGPVIGFALILFIVAAVIVTVTQFVTTLLGN